ncbi:3-carboxymuconate cyclase [Burkholderia ubonensis]|nr:3-carboxymuconate cyclase [Burkholderia ubonensis]
MNLRSCFSTMAAVLAALSLAACGGASKDSSTASAPTVSAVSGTVAYGHPVAGQTVVAIDTRGDVCARATTATDGSYAMSTTNCAPGSAALTVPGYTTPGGATLMAVAVPPPGSLVINGVVNIDPLTTLLAYDVAGLVSSPATPSTSAQVLALLPQVTATQYLQAKANILTASLLQALNSNGVTTTGFDLTTTPFVADGHGLDGFFDGNPLSAPTSSSVEIAAPESAGPLVRVTLPTTAGGQSVVTSVSSYTVGGSVSGLSGGSLTLLLNGGSALTVHVDGPFTFPTEISSTYTITVGTQPSGRTCTVSNSAGAGIATNVSNVSVTCSANTYTIAGMVSGLAHGSQVTLNNNGADSTIVAADGSFVFATPVAYNSGYAVTVGGQPVGQTCTVSNGVASGVMANVSNVSVTCSADTYTVSGLVSGLASGTQLTLTNNAADPTIVTGNGSFTFAMPVAYNGSYTVAVGTQPAGQTCTVANGSGAGVTGNVASVAVTCVTMPAKISFIYVPDYSNNQILGYSYNHTTGTVGAAGGGAFPAGTYPRWVVTNPAGTFLYAANINSNTVSAYTVNAMTGALTPVTGGPFAARSSPNGMVVNPAGTLLFVANSNDSSVSVYSINQTTGALTLVGSYAAGAAPTRLAITPNGQFLYAVNQSSHDVSGFAVDSSTGLLTPISGSPFNDAGAVSQGGYGITVNPTGTVLYVVNWEANITAFAINATTGALTPVSGSPFTANFTGWGWQSASLSPDGKLLFASTGNGGNLLTYSVDPTTGALTQLTADSYGAYGNAGANFTVPDPTGKYLYASNPMIGYVSVASINSATGAVQDLVGSPFDVGVRPFNLAIVNP